MTDTEIDILTKAMREMSEVLRKGEVSLDDLDKVELAAMLTIAAELIEAKR